MALVPAGAAAIRRGAVCTLHSAPQGELGVRHLGEGSAVAEGAMAGSQCTMHCCLGPCEPLRTSVLCQGVLLALCPHHSRVPPWLLQIKDHFIFTIESTGAWRPHELFNYAVQVRAPHRCNARWHAMRALLQLPVHHSKWSFCERQIAFCSRQATYVCCLSSTQMMISKCDKVLEGLQVFPNRSF